MQCTKCKKHKSENAFNASALSRLEDAVCFFCKRKEDIIKAGGTIKKKEVVIAKCLQCQKQYENLANNFKYGRCDRCKKGTSFTGDFLGSDNSMAGY